MKAREMIKKEDLPHLTFFTQFPKGHLSTPGVASALQNIEIAFRMAALRRWPAAMSLIWQSCELLLRVNLGIDLYDRTIEAHKMQDQFNKEKSLTMDLQNESGKFRQLRNQILHHGYSPKDDERCIEMYFGAGFAYCNRLVKELVGQDMIEIGRKENENCWFWDIFEDTRKVINKKVRKKLPLYPGLEPFVIVTNNINRMGGMVSKYYSPGDHNTLIWQEMFQDFEFDVRKRLGEEIKKELEEFGNEEIVFLPYFECFGRCNSMLESIVANIVSEPRDDGNYDLLQINAIGCVDCQYVLSDPDTVKVFVFDRLSEKQKQLVGCSDYHTASDHSYQGLLLSAEEQPKSWALYEEIKKEKYPEN